MRTNVAQTASKTGETVDLFGFVHVRRDHGKIVFIDLRDRSGIIQMVFTPGDGEMYDDAQRLRPEWVIHVTGEVAQRPEKDVNPDTPTGKIELQPKTLNIISEAKTPPFDIEGDGMEINEETRMEYRYVDLRRSRLRDNIMLRHRATSYVRDALNAKDFIEIETPTLTKTSPEGARDFLVPSRFHPGEFYALPQAPQQYKQLLMIAGFEKYFQIAHAFRDEDLRGDRQFEHTQIDLEMSYVTEEELRQNVEDMFIEVCEKLGKKISKKPFPVLTHEDAMKEHGADKFDLRSNKDDKDEMAFAWVTNFPMFEKDEETGKLTFAHNPFSAPKAEHVEKLMAGKDLEDLRAQQYDLVLNGYELASGGVRISDPKVQRKVFEILGLSPEETEERFGHILNAYEYGAPNHAGIAAGLDRFIMLLAGEDNIREVIAFPVSARGKTSVMNAPSKVDNKQLEELHIKTIDPNS